MSIRFGLYLIPEATDPFYQIGSSVVGYDVRNRTTVAPPEFIRPRWIAPNAQFGFHATITDAITINEKDLSGILEKVELLLSCLNPTNRYLLKKERVGFWRDSSNMAAVILNPNRSVEMLHDILVASLHPLGFSSEYFDKFKKNPDIFQPNSPASIQKTKQFYSPYIFDEFIPHFTCIHSYDGPVEKRVEVEENLAALFKDTDVLEFKKIAFVSQREGDPYFEIIKELVLN
jgi:hypothetical protein